MSGGLLTCAAGTSCGVTPYLPVRPRQRCAGLGALLSLAGRLLTVLTALAAGSDTAWGARLLLMPLWAGALLAVAATGRVVRVLASLARVLLLVQYGVVEWAFGGWQWAHPLLLAPVVACAALAARSRTTAPEAVSA